MRVTRDVTFVRFATSTVPQAGRPVPFCEHSFTILCESWPCGVFCGWPVPS